MQISSPYSLCSLYQNCEQSILIDRILLYKTVLCILFLEIVRYKIAVMSK